MINKFALALVASLGVAGVAAPAFAETTDSATGIDQLEQSYQQLYVNQLRDAGINAVSVEEWGTQILAYVQTDTGLTTQVFDRADFPPVLVNTL
jgi:hypothetical protein